jgi:hypothetical protein
VRRTSTIVVVALCGVLVAACGRHPDPLEIGLRRVALDLAFKDETKAAPVSPRQVVTQLQLADPNVSADVPVEEEQPRATRRVISIPRRPPAPVCEPAPPGANYDIPSYAVVKDPPAVGVYTRHNTGTVKIETAAFNLDLPYPPKSNVEISDIKFVTATAYLNGDDVKSLNLPSDVRNNDTAVPQRVEFTMTKSGPSGSKVVDTFRYSLGGATGGDYLWLIKRETTVSGVKTVFNPTPPIRYVQLFVTEGADESTHAGVDRATNTALSVQSKIVGRESVDVCGTVYDTFRVQIKENFVDLSKTPPVISGNENGTANFWNIEFDKGLLLVREEVHSTFRGSTEVAGAPVPVTVLYDYVSTLDAVTPKPPKAASTTPTTAPGSDEGTDPDAGEDAG